MPAEWLWAQKLLLLPRHTLQPHSVHQRLLQLLLQLLPPGGHPQHRPRLHSWSLHHHLSNLVPPGSNLSSLVQPGSTHLSSLIQPSLPLNLNYLNFSLLNSLAPLQPQGIKVKEAIIATKPVNIQN